jgi:hypothetical protein
MNAKLFKCLSLKERKSTLLKQGKHIADRNYYAQRLSLYSIKTVDQEFFAEVWRHPQTNKIYQITIPEDEKILDRYIDAKIKN